MKHELSLIENSLMDYCENWATTQEKEKVDKAFEEIETAIKHKELIKNKSSLSYIELVLTTYYFEDSIATDSNLQKRILKALKTIKRKLIVSENF